MSWESRLALRTEKESLLLEETPFAEEYLPEELPARDYHQRELADVLAWATQQRRPTHLWLHGPSGSGKTVTARVLLRELARHGGLTTAYVNCWQRGSLYSVLEGLTAHWRLLRAEQTTTYGKLERIRQHVGDGLLVLVLDELDRTTPQQRADILYSLLTGLPNLGLICVASSHQALLELDPRVQSRLAPRTIAFDPYPEEALIALLEQRARLALQPQSWKPSTLATLARLARGDARLALQTLRAAAQAAAREQARTIRIPHIRQVAAATPAQRWIFRLQRLSATHQLLYRLLEQAPGGE